jgi:hypothetical protein
MGPRTRVWLAYDGIEHNEDDDRSGRPGDEQRGLTVELYDEADLRDDDPEEAVCHKEAPRLLALAASIG